MTAAPARPLSLANSAAAMKTGAFMWEHLLTLDRESLLYNLGVQATCKAEQMDVSLESLSEAERAHHFPPSELIGLGERQFGRVEGQVRALLCGNDPADAAEREKLWQLVLIALQASGPGGAVGAVAGAAAQLAQGAAAPGEPAPPSQESLLALGGIAASIGKNFLVSSGLAEYVAALLLKRIVVPAADEGRQSICRQWAEASRARPADAGTRPPAASPPARPNDSRR